MADAHLAYQRAQFKTRLPTDRMFTKAHLWLQDVGAGVVRVGLTKFATRMLGEVVEYEFETPPDEETRRDVEGCLAQLFERAGSAYSLRVSKLALEPVEGTEPRHQTL